MTRKKVKLAYITNDSARKATYKKRKKGLTKKVSQLSTLCGIQACAILYSPYESQPEVWPSPGGVHRVLSEFKRMPQMEQSKKMMNQESFLGNRIAKAGEQLMKQCRDNREKEMTQVMFLNLTGNGLLLHGLNVMDLNDLAWVIDQKLNDVNNMVGMLSKACQGSEASTLVNALKATSKSNGKNLQAERSVPEPEANADAVQRRQGMLDMMMNPQDSGGFGGEEIGMLPLGDNSHNAASWSNAFFPWEK